MVVDDEERYRRFAAGMMGYGRNKNGVWKGDLNKTYQSRLDKDLKGGIVDGKDNEREYRYDPYCKLI